MCGIDENDTYDTCLTKDVVEKKCCSGFGISDTGLQCVATPTTACAGGESMFYDDSSSLSTTSALTNICTTHGGEKAQASDNGSCKCCVQDCKRKASAVIHQNEYHVETGFASGYAGKIKELSLTFFNVDTFTDTDAQSCLGPQQRLAGGPLKETFMCMHSARK